MRDAWGMVRIAAVVHLGTHERSVRCAHGDLSEASRIITFVFQLFRIHGRSAHGLSAFNMDNDSASND